VQQLHFVGFTTDHDGLIFSARKGSKSGGYVINLDGVLLAQIEQGVRWRDGGNGSEPSFQVAELLPPSPPPLPKRQPRPESHLTPRAIQARLRAGHSLADVATEAGVGEDWVARFAAPILHERASVIDQAGRLTAEKARVGPSYQPLATAVRWNLVERGIALSDDDYDDAWSAFQRTDGMWVARVSFVSRQRNHHADWLVDVNGGRLTALNRQAAELGYADASRRPPDDGLPPGPVTRPLIGVTVTPAQLSRSHAKPSQAPIPVSDLLPEDLFDDDDAEPAAPRRLPRRKPLTARPLAAHPPAVAGRGPLPRPERILPSRSAPLLPGRPFFDPAAAVAKEEHAPPEEMPPGLTVLAPRASDAARPSLPVPPSLPAAPAEPPVVAESTNGEGPADAGLAQPPAAPAQPPAPTEASRPAQSSSSRARNRVPRRAAGGASAQGQTPWWSPGPERPGPAGVRRVRPAGTAPQPSPAKQEPAVRNGTSPQESNGHAPPEEMPTAPRRRIRASEEGVPSSPPPADREPDVERVATPSGAYVPRLLRLAGEPAASLRATPPPDPQPAAATVTISSSPIIRARAVTSRRSEPSARDTSEHEVVDPAAPPSAGREAASDDLLQDDDEGEGPPTSERRRRLFRRRRS
jgi:hypothetical protein